MGVKNTPFSHMSELSSQHTLSMPHHDLLSIETRFLHLCLLTLTSLRIPWVETNPTHRTRDQERPFIPVLERTGLSGPVVCNFRL